MIIAGFMFCVGVLLFFVCVALALTFWREILFGIAYVVGGAVVMGLLWVLSYHPELQQLIGYAAFATLACYLAWMFWDRNRA